MKYPIVTIIGRPNVGKSTLFNRIVGKRVSITEDIPGVTRDRISHLAEWGGRDFILVDTGGLDFLNKEHISTEILEQAKIGIEETDVIIFIVDGKNGITPVDSDIAMVLRKSKKPTILAVNKLDDHSKFDNIYEFYSLGITEVEGISAEQALGIGDLLDRVIEHLPDTSGIQADDDITKIAFVGKPNVGKSSLINKILNENRLIVSDEAGTTRDSIHLEINIDDTKYILIDTAGVRRKRSITDAVERYSVSRTFDAIDRSDISILLIDAVEGITEQDSKIIGYAHNKSRALIILVNKWDLIEKDSSSIYAFEKKIRTELPFLSYVPILFISAKTGKRIDKIFDLVKIVDNNYHLRVSTGILNDIIDNAITFNPPPTDKGRRLKLYYSTQIQTAPPKFLLFVNDKELMHFSYLRYIENQIRDNFGFTGVPLTFELRNRKE